MCDLCGEKTHLKEMDRMHEEFLGEHKRAVVEYGRLELLMKNVAWFNFETKCRSWRSPWSESQEGSMLTLLGQSYTNTIKRGRVREVARFPTYYHGTVHSAPNLPPQIVLNELKLAEALVRELETQCAAPYEWAPGGRLYEQMLRESDGVRAYRELRN